MTTKIPTFSASAIEQISRVLGETVTGGEIGPLLHQCRIEEQPSESNTKWRRMRSTLSAQQNADGCANAVCQFIMAVMDPVRLVNTPDFFESSRSDLNKILAFYGLSLSKQGKLSLTSKATTLDEAEEKAKTLRHKLQGRHVHSEVLKYCRSELIQNNYFHAVLEAAKGIAERIRSMTGLTTDGAALFDEAFATHRPLLALNKLETESEQSEQKGFVNLLKGIFGAFRNPHAHTPKVVWKLEEKDAIDLLTMVSYVHRKLDVCVRTPSAPRQK
jgi:uncharacterized protein (TIGR02391 family)